MIELKQSVKMAGALRKSGSRLTVVENNKKTLGQNEIRRQDAERFVSRGMAAPVADKKPTSVTTSPETESPETGGEEEAG